MYKYKEYGSFCRYRKALYFWSLGISLYLELFCFLSFITIVLRNLCSGTHRRNQEYLHPWICISSVVWRTIFMFVFWTATLGHFHEYFLWKQAKHREEFRSLALETLLSTLGCCRQSSQQLFGYLRHENQLFCSSSVPGTTLLDWGHVYNIPHSSVFVFV